MTEGPQPQPPNILEELDPDARFSLLRGGKMRRAPWAEALTDFQFVELRQNASCGGKLSDDEMDFMLALRSPRAAAGLAYNRCGTGGELSRDEILGRAAATYGVPTVIMETQIAAEAQRKSVPDRLYKELLYAAFTDKERQGYARIADALNRGDYGAIREIVDSSFRNPTDAATYRRIMVEERNRMWIPILRRYLDEGDAVVLVGAAQECSVGWVRIRPRRHAGFRLTTPDPVLVAWAAL